MRGSWRRPRPPLPFGFGCAALVGEAASGQRAWTCLPRMRVEAGWAA